MQPMEVGVCSWSLERGDPVRALELAGKELGVRVVQVGFFYETAVETDPALHRLETGGPPVTAEVLRETARSAGVELCATFVKYPREDYSSIARVAATVGYASDEEYALRLELTEQVARTTAAVGCNLLAVHAGTIPAPADDPRFAQLIERVRAVAAALAPHGVRLLLETGQEPAEVLAGFLEALGSDNVGVNYDAGNFIIYGTDDPARAISKLKRWIANVHLKDAVPAARPGVELGRAVPLGTGAAQIPRVLSKLRALGYGGPLLIENTASAGGAEALPTAVEYVRSMLTHWGQSFISH